MKNKITLIIKYAIVLIAVFLLTNKKMPSTQQFHFVNFTREVFAETPDDKKIYSLDVKTLEKVEDELTKDGNDISGFPMDILILHGKKVKLTGYLLIPYDAYATDDSIDNFAVGKNAYGCPCCNWGNSPPPTIFNTVFVKMKEGAKLSPPFTPLVEVTGIFFAQRDYYIDENGAKQLGGLFFIQEAVATKKQKWF
jgi:hypothetical protein